MAVGLLSAHGADLSDREERDEHRDNEKGDSEVGAGARPMRPELS